MKIHRINAVTLFRRTLERLFIIVMTVVIITVLNYLLDMLFEEETPGLLAVLAQEAYAAIIAVPLILLIFAAADWSSWLATSPEGIQHHTLLYHKSSSWDNLQTIVQYKLSRALFISEEDVYMKHPARMDILRAAWLVNQPRASTTIPLSSIHINWRSTELGDELRRYAPQLFK